MKNRIVAPSRLVSALDACRSRLKAFIRGRTPLRDEADDILQEVTYLGILRLLLQGPERCV
ncbi:DNA-directed RNA polymerase specialized sigma subunit [Klebsiella michiganensis]|nr:DNA-directed RNA polymerase specialized sigma subunit [Klebsiella michiganensis]